MQALNFSTLMYKSYIPPGPDGTYFSNGGPTPIHFSLPPPSTLTLTPPPSTGRGRKGKSHSKRTIPKPSAPPAVNPETFGFGLHTPPESPEDYLDIRCRRGNSEVETPRSLSDLEDDGEEEEEMQDYRYTPSYLNL